MIILHSMRWPDEVRGPSALAPQPVEIGDSEIDGAVDLIEAMAAEDLTGFHDEYRTALEEVTHAKAEGHRVSPAEA
ncbi:hypothetical protein [Streptomyces lavendofoliae]|uniref:hypothetical protein n=1 Tax=Streptomyces lavendofoliae TaxID=67314 RepID=UPI003D8B37E8